MSKVKEDLEDKASERTIEKAINSMEGVVVRIDEVDRRKRYLELVTPAEVQPQA